jgi:hypothetical protein
MACPNNDPRCPDPPSTGPLVYEGMLPVLMGLTYAGPDVTVEKFFAGIKAYKAFRYHGINGRTADPSHFEVCVGASDGSQIGDVSQVVWNSTKRTAGNSTAGAYDYSTTRYRAGYVFT